MNPSTQDIIDGILATPAKTVFVLPNNKNIYLVAVQASKLVKDREVFVLNTANVPQGISAMLAFDPESDGKSNFAAMEEASKKVVSMSVTHAVRDTTIDGESIRSGQALGMINGGIASVADSSIECVEKLSEKMLTPSFITLFYGEDVSPDDAAKAEECIRNAHRGAEIAVINGGQPIYDYIISAE